MADERAIEAARRLAAEVTGCWDLAEPELRRVLSNANYNIVALRLEELRAALAAADRVAGEDRYRALLERCRCVLNNMAWERTGLEAFTKGRWPISHEPLRADAKKLLPEIEAALALSPDKSTSPFYKTLNEEAAEGEHCDLDYRPEAHPTPDRQEHNG